MLIHVQVDDAVGQALGDLEALGLDALEVLQRRIVDHVDVAGQQRSHAWAVAGDRPEGDGFPGTLVAPVVVVALEDDLLAAREFLELVHAGADGGLAGVEVLGLWIAVDAGRSEEHTSELQSLMRISYAVFYLKKKT